MNIVFWLGVAIAAFGLWYFLSTHFFKIGENFTNMVNNIKHEINKNNNEEDVENE